MEATFGGTSLAGERKDTHLSTKDLEKMGYHFCDTLLDYCDPDSSKVEACMRELQDKMRRQILRRLQLQNRNSEFMACVGQHNAPCVKSTPFLTFYKFLMI